jgi:hypothetical protein
MILFILQEKPADVFISPRPPKEKPKSSTEIATPESPEMSIKQLADIQVNIFENFKFYRLFSEHCV